MKLEEKLVKLGILEEKCKHCNGSGIIESYNAFGNIQVNVECFYCGGKGWVVKGVLVGKSDENSKK